MWNIFQINNWLSHWEPMWLFLVLFVEMVVGIATLTILVLEYFYDKQYNETKHQKRKASKHKVKVVIDADGNARIAEAPKDIDVSIEHEGK